MNSKNTIDISKLSQQEIKDFAVFLLNNISRSKEGLGKELFEVMARLMVVLTLEVVCLRTNPETGKVEVYLTLRSAHNSFPGQWHCPGSVMRSGEEIEDVLLRLEKKELGLAMISKKFVSHFNQPDEPRGHFFSLIYLCTLGQGKGHGKWFDINNLPKNTIEYHKKTIIPDAVKEFILN